MDIIINLISEEDNAVNDFLTKFFEKDMMTDMLTCEWSYTFSSPLSAVNLISSLMDSAFSSKIEAWISLDPNVFIKIREDNYNDIIKYIIDRFKEAS